MSYLILYRNLGKLFRDVGKKIFPDFPSHFFIKNTNWPKFDFLLINVVAD